MQDRFLKFEIGGIFFVLSFSVFLQNLYTLSGHNLLGIMFGSVNNSIWEITKTLLLPFVLWSMIELLSVKVPFHRFVIAKTISLYCLGVVYIALCLIISLFGLNSSYLPEFAAAIVCVAAALYLSYRLTMSSLKTDNIFKSVR
jgi:hypothetical protein